MNLQIKALLYSLVGIVFGAFFVAIAYPRFGDTSIVIAPAIIFITVLVGITRR